MLKPYFESKIGSSFGRKKVTGNTFFTEVYARNYIFEPIWVSDKEVCIRVTSYDLAPSGGRMANTSIDFGEIVISIDGVSSLDSLLEEIINKKDSAFIEKYFSAVNNK